MMQGMRNAFDQAKKDRYKAALARAGGTPMSNVDIVSIKQVHARKIRVEAKVSTIFPRKTS